MMICYLYMGTTFAILPRAGICQAFCPEVDQKSDPGINFIKILRCPKLDYYAIANFGGSSGAQE